MIRYHLLLALCAMELTAMQQAPKALPKFSQFVRTYMPTFCAGTTMGGGGVYTYQYFTVGRKNDELLKEVRELQKSVQWCMDSLTVIQQNNGSVALHAPARELEHKDKRS